MPDKELYTADTLSRAPIAPPGEGSISSHNELESALDIIISSLPASQHRLQEYQNAQAQDPVCTQIYKYCRDGLPSRSQTPSDIHLYRQARNKLSVVNDLLLYSSRIVIPSILQPETLKKIHQGHQGIQRCRLRASMSVWWPGMSTQIKAIVEQCPECAKPHCEHMVSSTLPDYPWQRLDPIYSNSKELLT